MVCYLTSKRITYFLIIRQLRFDRYDFVASELERLFFNSLGNLDLSNLPPSDELQRIIGSNCICTELLSSAQSSLDILTKNAAPNEHLLRRPKLSNLSINEDAFVVSQDDVSSPVTLLADPNTEIGTALAGSSSTVQPTEESSVTQVLKRGRPAVHSSSSSSSAQEQVTSDTPQTEEIVSELKKISQELRNEDKVSQEQSTNSFLSLKRDTVESPQCDVVPKTSSTVDDDLDNDLDSVLSEAQIEPISSETTLKPELPGSYTKYKIVKITEDEATDTGQPDPQVSDEVNSPKSGLSLTNNLYLSGQHTDESQEPRYYKFSDYGRPEDFANCPKPTPASSEKNLQHKQETKVSGPNLRASASGYSKPVQSNSIDSCSSKSTPPHRLSDNTELLNLDHNGKVKVLNILSEGWKVHVAFEKRVRKEIPCAGKSSLEEILYAVFGYEASTFVEFKTTEKNRINIRLNPSYKAEHFETILATIEGLQV